MTPFEMSAPRVAIATIVARNYLSFARVLALSLRAHHPHVPFLAVVAADGLSARALQQHALPLLLELRPRVEALGLSLGPVCVALQARVALGDEAGVLLKAAAVLVLIVVFIQKRPQGLFAVKGRSAEA